jgi:hypothetical protein
MLARLLLAPVVRNEAMGGIARRPARLPHADSLRDLDQGVRRLPEREDLAARRLRTLVPVKDVLAFLAEVRRPLARCRVAARQRLDELVLGRAVAVERRALAGARVNARHAPEARSLVEPVAPVEAVQPDDPVVPLRARRASGGLVPRLRHRTRVAGGPRATSDGTMVPSGASGKPLQARDFHDGVSPRTRVRRGGQGVSVGCTHFDLVRDVTPSAEGCEDCLRIGGAWVHLRLCLIRGHVGCCDQSPNRHATGHYQATGHPLIRSFEPGEAWAYCYPDGEFFEELPAPPG